MIRGPELAVSGGFRAVSRKIGLTPSVQSLLQEIIPVQRFVAIHQGSDTALRTVSVLGLGDDDRILLRIRRQGAGGQWFRMISSWMPADLFEDICSPDSDTSSFQKLAETRGITAAEAFDSLAPHRLAAHEARALERPQGEMALRITRVVHDQTGRCLELAVIVSLPDLHESCYRYRVPDPAYADVCWPWDADGVPHATPATSKGGASL